MNHFAKSLVQSIARNGQQFETENYVSSPPAAWVVNPAGEVFELGTKRYADADAIGFHQKYGTDPRGQFAFNVLVNGVDTGEYASSIERRNGRVRIFTADGWKVWNGRTFF